MFKAYNVAFSFKNSTYPIDQLLKITLLNDTKSLKKYLDANVIFHDIEFVYFSKSNNGQMDKVR
jgi:hypothetical protein